MTDKNETNQEGRESAAAGSETLPRWHRPAVTVMPLAVTPHGPGSPIDELAGGTPSL